MINFVLFDVYDQLSIPSSRVAIVPEAVTCVLESESNKGFSYIYLAESLHTGDGDSQNFIKVKHPLTEVVLAMKAATGVEDAVIEKWAPINYREEG